MCRIVVLSSRGVALRVSPVRLIPYDQPPPSSLSTRAMQIHLSRPRLISATCWKQLRRREVCLDDRLTPRDCPDGYHQAVLSKTPGPERDAGGNEDSPPKVEAVGLNSFTRVTPSPTTTSAILPLSSTADRSRGTRTRDTCWNGVQSYFRTAGRRDRFQCQVAGFRAARTLSIGPANHSPGPVYGWETSTSK